MSIPDQVGEQPLEERYARSQTGRRLLLWVIGPLIAAVVVLLAWAAWNQSQPDLRYNLQTWQRLSPHEISYTVAINRSTDAAVVCDVTVQADDHTKVAETTLRLPGGESGLQVVTRTVRTERPGGSVTVDTCRTVG